MVIPNGLAERQQSKNVDPLFLFTFNSLLKRTPTAAKALNVPAI